MKKIIALSGVLCAVASTSASATQISVAIGVPAYVAEPVYVEPTRGYVMAPDWPSEHYDRHRHPHNDYWARKQQEEREHAEHDAHDNGKHDHK